jgi:hypothetical protein
VKGETKTSESTELEFKVSWVANEEGVPVKWGTYI